MSIFGNFIFGGGTSGGGEGTGWSGEVENFGNLPTAALNPDKVYLVKTSDEYFWGKRAGLYISDGTNWSRLSELRVDVLDSEFVVRDDVDSTKGMKIEVGGVTTGQVRTLTMPDYDVDLGDMGGSTEPIYFFEGDTASELQILIDLASSNGGGIIQLQARAYVFVEVVNIPDNIHIKGAGRSSTTFDHTNMTSPLFHIEGLYITISDMYIESEGSNTNPVILSEGDCRFFKLLNVEAYVWGTQNWLNRIDNNVDMRSSLFENLIVSPGAGNSSLSGSDFINGGDFSHSVFRDITWNGRGRGFLIISSSHGCKFSYISASCGFNMIFISCRAGGRYNNTPITTFSNCKCGGGGNNVNNDRLISVESNASTGYDVYFTDCDFAAHGPALLLGLQVVAYISNCKMGGSRSIHAAGDNVRLFIANSTIGEINFLTRAIGESFISNSQITAILASNETREGRISLMGGSIDSLSAIAPNVVHTFVVVEDTTQMSSNLNVAKNLNVGEGDLVVDATTGVVSMGSTPTYEDNATALAGGLVAGDIYATATGELRVVI